MLSKRGRRRTVLLAAQALINLLLRAGRQVKAHQIQFRPIGKQSPAHKLALATFRGDRAPDRIIGEEELLGEF